MYTVDGTLPEDQDSELETQAIVRRNFLTSVVELIYAVTLLPGFKLSPCVLRKDILRMERFKKSSEGNSSKTKLLVQTIYK
jgi:hypothetical protein